MSLEFFRMLGKAAEEACRLAVERTAGMGVRRIEIQRVALAKNDFIVSNHHAHPPGQHVDEFLAAMLENDRPVRRTNRQEKRLHILVWHVQRQGSVGISAFGSPGRNVRRLAFAGHHPWRALLGFDEKSAQMNTQRVCHGQQGGNRRRNAGGLNF